MHSGQIAGIVIGVLVVATALAVLGWALYNNNDAPPSGKLLLAGGYVDGQGALARSTDGGKTWRDVQWPFKLPNDKTTYLTSMTHDGRRFLASTPKQYMISVDGVRWTEGALPADADALGSIVAVSSNGDNGHVVLGYTGGLSYFNGSAWTSFALKGVNARHAAFHGAAECAVATDSGIYYTRDAGVTWRQLNGAFAVYDIVRLRAGWVAALGETGTAVLADGQSAPEILPTATNLTLATNDAVTVIGTNQGVTLLTANNIIKKTSGPPLTSAAWSGQYFIGANHAAAVHISADGGVTWTSYTPWPGRSDVVIQAVAGK